LKSSVFKNDHNFIRIGRYLTISLHCGRWLVASG
jgi:hypothetical protein